METVADMRAALAAEQARAYEVSEAAMQAIATLLTMSQWTLTILAIVLGVIAIFGWVTIYRAAIKLCTSIANRRLDSYISSDEFKTLIEEKVAIQIEKEWEDRVVSTALDKSDKSDVENSPFPAADKKGDTQ